MQAADAPQTSHRPQVVADTSFSAPAHSRTREGAPLAGKGASARAVPDGNHGDNLQTTKPPMFKPGFGAGLVSGFLYGVGLSMIVGGVLFGMQNDSYRAIAEDCLRALK